MACPQEAKIVVVGADDSETSFAFDALVDHDEGQPRTAGLTHRGRSDCWAGGVRPASAFSVCPCAERAWGFGMQECAVRTCGCPYSHAVSMAPAQAPRGRLLDVLGDAERAGASSGSGANQQAGHARRPQSAVERSHAPAPASPPPVLDVADDYMSSKVHYVNNDILTDCVLAKDFKV